MFLKFRVKAALAKFIQMNGCSGETLKFFESGVIDSFMRDIEWKRFDANQGAVMIITGSVVNGVETGGLSQIKEQFPQIYRDIVTLWHFCAQLLTQDDSRWGDAFIIGNIEGNPFDHV